MNETLIKEIVLQIMNDPEIQRRLLINQNVISETAKMKMLVLLNYVPNLAGVLEKLARKLEGDYRVSVLGTDAVMKEQLTLPNRMRWVSCAEAIEQRDWQLVFLPTCSANTLAKIALGVRDNAVTKLAGRAIAEGIPVEVVTDYLGFTAQTPLAYRQLYEGYIEKLCQYGIILRDRPSNYTVPGQGLIRETVNFHEMMIPQQDQLPPKVCGPVDEYTTAAVIFWEGKLMTEADAVNLPEESVIRIGKKTIISPSAKDRLRQRNIEIVKKMEV